jgi:hypothetical protein
MGMLMIPFPYLARRLSVAGALLLAFVVGCDAGPRSSVEGDVHYDGEKVNLGGIAFIPVDEGERAAGQIIDGHYLLDSHHGPNPGKHRVEIHWRKKTGNKVPGEGGHPRDEIVPGIPPKYNTESELIVEIKPGRNTFVFDLKK